MTQDFRWKNVANVYWKRGAKLGWKFEEAKKFIFSYQDISLLVFAVLISEG